MVCVGFHRKKGSLHNRECMEVRDYDNWIMIILNDNWAHDISFPLTRVLERVQRCNRAVWPSVLGDFPLVRKRPVINSQEC